MPVLERETGEGVKLASARALVSAGRSADCTGLGGATLRHLVVIASFDAGDQGRRADFQDLAELEKHLHSRRFLVEFKEADVVARNASAGRQFLLGHLRFQPFIA